MLGNLLQFLSFIHVKKSPAQRNLSSVSKHIQYEKVFDFVDWIQAS